MDTIAHIPNNVGLHSPPRMMKYPSPPTRSATGAARSSIQALRRPRRRPDKMLAYRFAAPSPADPTTLCINGKPHTNYDPSRLGWKDVARLLCS